MVGYQCDVVVIWALELTRPVAEEELSEEDQQLKNELDLMVERLMVSVACPAII